MEKTLYITLLSFGMVTNLCTEAQSSAADLPSSIRTLVTNDSATTAKDVSDEASSSSKFRSADNLPAKREIKEEEKKMFDAVFNEDTDTIMNLIKQGISVDLKDLNGYTLLMRAAHDGKQKSVEYLMSIGADVKAQNNGATALIIAAEKGYLEIVKILIDKSDIDATDRNNETALIWATRRGHFDIAKFLIENGANIKVHSQAPLSFKRGVLSLLFGGLVPAGPIYRNKTTWRKGIAEFAEYLINHGAEVDDADEFGSTPLMEAARCSNFLAVETLVKHGANVNAANNAGYTPLLKAATRSNLKLHPESSLEICEYLLKNGADIRAKDHNGMNLLLHAVEKGYIPIVDLAIKHGLDVRERDNRHLSPLMLAANREDMDMIKYLTTQLELVKDKRHPRESSYNRLTIKP